MSWTSACTVLVLSRHGRLHRYMFSALRMQQQKISSTKSLLAVNCDSVWGTSHQHHETDINDSVFAAKGQVSVHGSCFSAMEKLSSIYLLQGKETASFRMKLFPCCNCIDSFNGCIARALYSFMRTATKFQAEDSLC